MNIWTQIDKMEIRNWNNRFIKKKNKRYGRKLNRAPHSYWVDSVPEISKPKFFDLVDNSSDSSKAVAVIVAAAMAKKLRVVFRVQYDGTILQNS